MRKPAASVLALALVAAGCESGQPTAPPAPEAEGGAAISGEPVRVGLLYTISGDGQEFAQPALGAAALAIDEARQRGIDLEVVTRDYGGTARRARSIAEALAGEGAAGIVVASDDPSLGPALAGFDGPPVVHALIPDDGVVTAEGPTFRVAPTTELQARKLASFLVGDRGYDAVAILEEATPFGRQGGDDLERALERQGADVVLRDRFRIGGDIHTPVMYAGQLEADALVVWTRDPAEAGRITIEVHDAGQAYQLALSGSLATFDYGKNASSQVTPVAFRDGILSVGTWAGPWFDLNRLTGFFERFREENDAEAPVQTVQIYDAVLVLAAAARRAGIAGPEGTVRELEGLSGFVGVGVPLSFSADDHEGIGPEDMAVLAFTKDQEAAGGEFAPDVSTGGGFFTIDTRSVQLPPDLAYLLEGLPA